MNRYNATLSDVLSPKFANLVWQHATKDTSVEQEQLVALLRECIMIRDNVFTLPNFYTVADVHCIIFYVGLFIVELFLLNPNCNSLVLRWAKYLCKTMLSTILR